MYRVKVCVTLKEGILDPGGAVAKDALHRLGFDQVQSVQAGKLFELTVEHGGDINKMCKALLVNTVMEDYSYEIEELS